MWMWWGLGLWAGLWGPSWASKCYTCSGGCYAEEGCDCRFGFCEAPFCFTERKPQFQDKNLKFQVVKGCAKEPAQALGCEFVRDKTSLACVCRGEFCNADVQAPQLREPTTECYQCQGQANCDETCMGHYCAVDLFSGVESCGFGLPYLPYTGGQRERLLEESPWATSRRKTKACVATQLGIHKHAECVCRGDLCNREGFRQPPQSPMDLYEIPLMASRAGELPELFNCFSCSRHSEDNVLPPECQEDTCQGQFCILSIETRTKDKPRGVIRNAGCLNATEAGLVQLGCTQKWRGAEHEMIHCACQGHFCNVNLHTAFASSSLPRLVSTPLHLATLLAVLLRSRPGR